MSIQRVRRHLARAAVHCELVVMAAVVVYPLVWVVGASFGPDKGLANASAIPAGATLDNYRELLTGTDYPRWYLNSLIVATANAVLSVLLSAFNAYVFSRLRFRGRSAGLLVMLVLQVFPSFLTAIAVYMLFLNLGLLDSLVGLVVVSVAAQLPYNTWLLKGYMDNISTSFDEAALMDSSPEKKTIAIGLFAMVNDATRNDFTLFAAGAVLVAVPITILYIVLQRYLISGLTVGGEKG